MANTAEEILATALGETTEEESKLITIDLETREIHIPASIKHLGVESDDDVLRLDFSMPRWYNNEIDLFTFDKRINYQNARGGGDVYKIDDAVATEDAFTFTWLVGRNAAMFKGAVKFNVCLKNTHPDDTATVLREFNTTVATLNVLEGLETSEAVVQEHADILEAWERKLFGTGNTVEQDIRKAGDSVKEDVEAKGEMVLATIPDDYQTLFDQSSESLRTRANAIVQSIVGAAGEVTDASGDPLRGLKLYGRTKAPLVTTGKNLLNATEMSKTLTNGVILTYNDDGTIVLNGTGTGNSATAIGTFEGNGEFIFSVENSGALNGSYLYIAKSDENIGWYGTDKTFTNDGTKRTVFIVVVAGTYDRTVIKPMIRLSSITDGIYEAYTGGLPSPSPSNPQTITSIGESGSIKAYICGKNLLNVDDLLTFEQFLSIESYIPAGTYKISFTSAANDGGTASPCVKFVDNNLWVNFEENKVLSISLAVPETALYFYSNGQSYTNSANISATITNLMLSKEGELYESYIENVISMATPNGLPGIPVTSDGNYTDANGQQWVCDEVDFEQGVYIKRVAKETMTVAPTFEESTDLANRFVSYGNLSNTYKLATTPSIGNIAKWTAWGIHDGGEVPTMALHNASFYFSPVEAMTVSEVNTLFANLINSGTPPVFMGQLAEVVEIPLSEDELNAFYNARSIYPVTNVYNDAGAWMEVKYNADTELFFDKSRGASDEQVDASVRALATEQGIAVPSDEHIEEVAAEYMDLNGMTEARVRAIVASILAGDVTIGGTLTASKVIGAVYE